MPASEAMPPTRALRSHQVALQAGAVLDIPPRTRRVLAVAALVGLGLLVMGTLASPRPQDVEIDKVLHMGGFATLGALLVLSLRPLLFVPALAGLVAAGVGLEFVQQVIGRSFEWRDALANGIGVAIGAGLGLVGRMVYAYVRRELASAEVRRRLRRLAPGELLFAAGDAGADFYLVRSGEIGLWRGKDRDAAPLGVFRPGDVVGAATAILGQRRALTARARTEASVYPMTLPELVEAAGGRGQPVAAVLTTLAESLGALLARLDAAERDLADLTTATRQPTAAGAQRSPQQLP